ncbi:hypothetical protein ABH920_007888 [Catenulispora sp. EB89]|uniref:tubulin-like doman-containing protein n=1 Tax=Catenulispora sp. EB89 TaxID=3156257 RepID=UPI003514C76C
MKLTTPMLYVGLGGTGCLIGTELERRLRDELCGPDGTALLRDDQTMRPFQLPGFLQFVYADLNEAELSKVRSRSVPTEEHLVAASMTQHFANKLVPHRFHSYPDVALALRTGAAAETKDWLPPQVGEPRVAPLVRGAGQLPTVGRAALFETIRSGISAIHEPLNEALIGIAQSAGVIDRAGGEARAVGTCDVFVGFSIAGGTGAGIFYDFLHIIGERFAANGFKAQIHPLVLMPSAFLAEEGGGRRAQLNAATSMLDLFRLVDDQNSPGASHWLGDRRITDASALNNVIMVEGRNSLRDAASERVSVAYPDAKITLDPATVQTAFLFSQTVAIQRDDLHRSIVSFILSMIGTEHEPASSDAPAPEQVYQSFAADFINQGVERQTASYAGIGLRPVSTSLVASMTVPVDDLADIVSSRLLARAVDELSGAPGGGTERNRELIEAFFASCGLEELRVREPEPFQEPAPVRGTQAVLRTLHTRVNTMDSRLPVLAGRLRAIAPRLARDFDYRRGVREALTAMDPFRLQRVALGDQQLLEPADRVGFVGSLEARRQAPVPPAGITMAPPPVATPTRRLFRGLDWTDPDVRAQMAKQDKWYKWRAESLWNNAWGDVSVIWDPRVLRLRAEVTGLASAFLTHARSEPDAFRQRTSELYRRRGGITYLLPPIGDLDVFYRSVVRRFLARPELNLRPTSTEAEIVAGLLGSQGWRHAYDQISPDSTAENRYDAAVQYVRNILKQQVKVLFVTRGMSGEEQPLLPSLRDLLARSAGKEGPTVGEGDLTTFQQQLASMLPASFVPAGSGQLKVLVAYPAGAKDALVEQHIQKKLNFPEEPSQAVQFRAVDAESVTIVLFRTSMGLADVPELRQILAHWNKALHNEQNQDFLAWRQRLGYNYRHLASTRADRQLIMHHLLCAMWNGQVTVEGRRSSPDHVIISLPGDQPVSVRLAVTGYGNTSSWADLISAYERWIFSNDAQEEQIRPEFCERLMRTLPANLHSRPNPSALYTWFMTRLKPHQTKALDAWLAIAPVGSRTWIKELREFWTDTVEQADALEFQEAASSPLNSLRAMFKGHREGWGAGHPADDLESLDEDEDGWDDDHYGTDPGRSDR